MEDADAPTYRVVCDAGPDTGATARIGPAGLVVGRSPTADLTIGDHTAELHHLLLEPLRSGVRVTQLSGRTVARVGDRALTPAGAAGIGDVITFGSSRLRLDAPPDRAWPFGGVADVLLTAGSPRTSDDGSLFQVHIGVDGSGAPVVTALEPGTVVQLVGPGATGVARSFVVQLSGLVPPDRVALRLAGATGWLPDGVRLPHLGPGGAGEHRIVFVTDPGSFDLPALRARLDLPVTAAIVVIDERATAPEPGLPGGRLALGALGRGRWAPGPAIAGSGSVHASGVTTTTVERFAASEGPTPGPPPSPGWRVPIEALVAGDPIDTIEVVGTWRRATGSPALWLGRDGTIATWWSMAGGPVAVIGTDDQQRGDVLATFAAALAIEHGPHTFGLVLGEAIAGPGPTHTIGEPLPPARLGHELVRPHPRTGRASIVVVDDPTGLAAADGELDPVATIATSAAAGRHVVIGMRPDHPWASALLGDPAVAVVVTGLPDERDARGIVGDTRAARLTSDQVLVRLPGSSCRVLTLRRLDEPARRSLRAVLDHALALSGEVGAPDPGDVVRSCEPWPDDDSPWAPPSSDPSSATTLVPASSSG